MTKKGYLNKFILAALVLTIGACVWVYNISDSKDIGTIIGVVVVFLGTQLVIASAVIALIWEFFST